MRFRDRFLALITDPNVAYILMMVGMLGLFFELSNPGVILPGVLGGISLILAFFAFQSLPINWAGLLLILFGVVLLVAEIKVVSHGVLTIGGVVVDAARLAHALRCAGDRAPHLVVRDHSDGGRDGGHRRVRGVRGAPRPLPAAARPGWPAWSARSASSSAPLDPEGQVMIDGELWRAVAADGPVPAGEAVEVARMDGLTLTVTRKPRPQL